jgi:riboflavin synthase
MFTGLVADLGRVEVIEAGPEGARLRIATKLAHGLREGDSVSVNGVCLTVTEPDEASFSADVMNQTLNVTTLGDLETGARVNLEPALRAGDPLGGHIVQGHVDGVATVKEVSEDGFALRVRLALSDELLRYVVEHGSVALDGVSLTVAGLDESSLEVSLIPETQERTTFGAAPPELEGRRVNVEIDVIARYAERLLQPFIERSKSNA